MDHRWHMVRNWPLSPLTPTTRDCQENVRRNGKIENPIQHLIQTNKINLSLCTHLSLISGPYCWADVTSPIGVGSQLKKSFCFCRKCPASAPPAPCSYFSGDLGLLHSCGNSATLIVWCKTVWLTAETHLLVAAQIFLELKFILGIQDEP